MKGLLILLAILAVLGGCSKQENNSKSKISIRIDRSMLKNIKLEKVNPVQNNWGLPDPTSYTQFNCFGVLVTYPEIGNSNNCKNTSDVIISQPDFVAGTVSVGANLTAEVLSGQGRIIQVFAFVSNVACPDVRQINDTIQQSLSAPYAIGQATVDLFPGSIENVDVTASFGSAVKVNDCNGPLFSWSFVPANFGSGLDGDVTVTNGTYDVTADTSILGRILSSNKYVTAIDATGSVVTLNSVIAANEIQVGDEVMWHVLAAGDDASNGCGPSNMHRAAYGFSKVSAITGANFDITISPPITQNPGSIIGANITNVPATGGAFCAIQIIRVPHFNNLTLDTSGGLINFGAPAVASGILPRTGGVMVMRVAQTLTLSGANGVFFDMANQGFAPGNGTDDQGEGHNGPGANTTTTANGNGGGGSTTGQGAGGGAGAGNAGGDGYNSAGSGGLVNSSYITACSNAVSCVLLGGGGGRGANNGANGSGAILLYAKNITGTELLINVTSDQPALNATLGNGGGGAGMIHLEAIDITVSSMTLMAEGGASGAPSSGTDGGGGGGGGLVNIEYCTGTAPSVNVNGGTAATGYSTGNGSNGGTGVLNLTQHTAGTFFCP